MAKGKAEVGTPKWLANKMKSKGLQKLRWFCQMCQKQCRDQNGFKCHIASESHQRQLLLFGENPGKYLWEFSKEFDRDFTDILRRCHGTKRVFANQVYQEYIRDKNHVHMNATKWVTLSGYVRYLGATGKCKIEESEKGWWITWIDRDPDTIARQKALAKRDKMAKDDDERMAEFVAKQVERHQNKQESTEASSPPETELPTELTRKSEDEKIQLQGLKLEKKEEKCTLVTPIINLKPNIIIKNKKEETNKRKKSAIEALIEEEIREKEAKRLKRREKEELPWLKSRIIVKIKTKSLGEKYYKQKGEIMQVMDKFKALIQLLNNAGNKVTVDQNDLETVIPSIGRQVLVLNGKYRGEKATLKALNVDTFSAELKLVHNDKCIQLPYEHFSKLAS